MHKDDCLRQMMCAGLRKDVSLAGHEKEKRLCGKTSLQNALWSLQFKSSK